MDVCLHMLKESKKFWQSSVWNSVLIISHINFRDCRVHNFADNLSRNSYIRPQLLWVKSYANEERCKTMTSAKIRLLHIVMVSWILCACYKDTHPRYFRSSFLFWCVFNRQHEHDMIECAFIFYSLLRASSNRCVFVQNGQPVGVDGRSKWIEMYAISNENVLDWTRPRIRAMYYWAILKE